MEQEVMGKGKYRGKVVIQVWENCLPEVEFSPEESETFTYREVGWMKRGLDKKLGMIHKQILRDEKMAEREAESKCPVCGIPGEKRGEDYVCMNEECREFSPPVSIEEKHHLEIEQAIEDGRLVELSTINQDGGVVSWGAASNELIVRNFHPNRYRIEGEAVGVWAAEDEPVKGEAMPEEEIAEAPALIGDAEPPVEEEGEIAKELVTEIKE